MLAPRARAQGSDSPFSVALEQIDVGQVEAAQQAVLAVPHFESWRTVSLNSLVKPSSTSAILAIPSCCLLTQLEKKCFLGLLGFSPFFHFFSPSSDLLKAVASSNPSKNAVSLGNNETWGSTVIVLIFAWQISSEELIIHKLFVHCGSVPVDSLSGSVLLQHFCLLRSVQ